MPQPDFPAVPSGAGLDGVKDYLIMLRRRLNDFLAHLDTLNVDELNADVINAGTLNAALVTVKSALAAGASITIDSTGMRINDGTKDVFLADITGLVTMVGAIIKSADSDNRVEMNATENLLKAINTAGGSVSIIPNITGTPAIQFTDGTNTVRFVLSSTGVFSINSSYSATGLTLASGKGILLNPAGGYYVQIPNWGMFYSNSDDLTLKQELDAIKTRLAAGGL